MVFVRSYHLLIIWVWIYWYSGCEIIIELSRKWPGWETWNDLTHIKPDAQEFSALCDWMDMRIRYVKYKCVLNCVSFWQTDSAWHNKS